MEFRKSTEQDLADIIKIINAAKEAMKNMGLIQWQDGNPSDADIAEGIAKGDSYVATDGGVIIGHGSLVFDIEPTYGIIVDGAWKSDKPYATVHRVATDKNIKRSGVASFIMQEFESLCTNRGVEWLRIDTHEDNLPMRRLIDKCGFTFSGKVFVANNSPRLAYEKYLK